ncbi:Archaeal putative transposase ISC1217 [Metallosphaera yellowstonensis MK1]|uniref:Archaeal putative transposase ISC1217 n=1 Tax=Metallosphaera yellowstonensis MK1 TaxID=671065 RepID=H2C4H1_9CREN|nr:Archaeal putative transposase ISC1217 [Metallosphaera yellowstonensis MK1]
MVRGKGRSRKVGLTLVLMVLVGGRASVRNRAETFGLDYANLLEALGELDDAWRSCQTGEGSGCHHGRHRGPRRSRGT